jgi:hypothetical protein
MGADTLDCDMLITLSLAVEVVGSCAIGVRAGGAAHLRVRDLKYDARIVSRISFEVINVVAPAHTSLALIPQWRLAHTRYIW